MPLRALAVHEPPYTDAPTSEFADHLDKLVADGRAPEAAAEFLELMGTPPPVIAEMKAAPYWAHDNVLISVLNEFLA